jgi:YVTN family beta-propeller protein
MPRPTVTSLTRTRRARRAGRVTALTLLLSMLFSLLPLGATPAAAQANPCEAPANEIVAENCASGAPVSEWDLGSTDSSQIEGFATDISVDQGQTVRFKVRTPATDYRIDVYRMGYYGGLGARKVAEVHPGVSLPQSQPSCLSDGPTGLVDCGNWDESAAWAVPANAVSGVYLAKLVREDGTAGVNHIHFVVRDDDGGSDLLYQTSDTTWQAYNSWGGNSLYRNADQNLPAGRAFKVSYNRPFDTRFGSSDKNFLFNAEQPMIRWLERNGYDVSYTTGVDTDRRGAELLEHDVFLSVGHDEYWSGQQRANVEAARDAGVHLAFFSGNEVFWKTRWETSIDGSGTSHRTLVTYKETHANEKIDPLPNVWTGTWRDPRFPTTESRAPENGLTGTIFTVQATTGGITVPEELGKMRLWRNTTVATLPAGQSATVGTETLGFEWDEDLDNGARPAGLMKLSATTADVAEKITDFGTNVGPGTASHSLTLHRRPSGALVFGAGTIQYSWGLDSVHARGPGATSDVRLQQATLNLFADMGVQPGTRQADLVAATASTDTTRPTSAIASPATGSTATVGTAVTISGTASDGGGGVLGGVEVSTDGGVTWHPASGRGAWSYSWTPNTAGTFTIQTRAVDDSGNVEIPAAGISVTADLRPCPCSVWNDATVPTKASESSTQPTELGVKFRADVNGYITGIRFYKGPTNTGTHVARLWTSTGTLLASATYQNESAQGWQQVNFPSPVAITGNTIYVASYFAPNGGWAADTNYFGTSDMVNAPLRLPASGTSGGNGVYWDLGGFPNASFGATNYWVDPVFHTDGADTAAPAISNVQISGSTTSAATISWLTSESADSQIEYGTTTAYGSSTTLDTALVTSHSQTLAELQPNTLYHYRLKSRDAAGNLATSADFTFTTALPQSCPCTLWDPSVVPAISSENTIAAHELGVRFRSDAAGYVKGIRFYKGPANAGTHLGSLWTNTGTLLASATFTGETASGWQQVTFATPVPIAADTAYVASYHAPNGGFSVNPGYFAGAGVEREPLRAPATGGADGPNGIYREGASGFPSQTFNGNNYWVDVLFDVDADDVGAPGIGSVQATGLTQTTATISWSTNEPADTQVEYGPTTAYGSSTTLDPTPTMGHTQQLTGLTDNTLYHYRVKSRDAAGNLATSVDFTFITAGADSVAPTITAVQAADVGTAGATISWATDEPADTQVEYGTTTSYGSSTALNTSLVASHSQPLSRLQPDTLYHYRVKSKDAAGNMTTSADFTFTTLPCPCTMWGIDAPAGAGAFDNGGPLTVGIKIQIEATGYVTGVRFYKPAGDLGTHTGKLWTIDGALRASVLFAGESESGWQSATFSPPIDVTPGQRFVVSMDSSLGRYVGTSGYFAGGDVSRGPVTALGNGVTGGNGVFGTGGFPTSSYDANNYWVDLVFDTVAADNIPPAISAVEAIEPTTAGVIIGYTTNEAADTQIEYGPTTSYGATTALEPAFVTSHTHHLTGLAAGQLYHYRVKSKDAAGNMTTSADFTFTTAAPQDCPCSMWSDTTAPTFGTFNNVAALELAAKFRADVDGYVFGVRFFKGAGDPGTHVGKLYTVGGELLGSVAFANETASGWQQATFASPIQVSRGATYLVAYDSSAGRYAGIGGYFGASGVTSGPLRMLRSGFDGPNGVYKVGGGFPTDSFNANNYGVDLVFNTSVEDTTAPDTTIGTVPSNPSNSASALFAFTSSEAGSTFQCSLDGGAFGGCASPLSYSGLADGSHTFQVRAIDVVGNTDLTAASHIWTVDTLAPDTTITASPLAQSSSTAAAFQFTSSETGSTFECRLDGAAFGACTSPREYSGLGQGAHTFEARAIDAAGNADATSASHTWTVDTVAPAAPSAPDLDAASDTGASSSDNLTGDTTPTFGGTAEPGVTVELFRGTTSLGTTVATAGVWSFTAGVIADGSHGITARVRDAAGNESPSSAALDLTIDATAPAAPSAPDLAAVSDTGASSSDDLTTDTTPSFAGTAEASSQVELSAGTNLLGTATTDATGHWVFNSGVVAAGTHAITARATDAAGNVSAVSATLTITIDTSAPAAPSAPDLDAASDTGASSTDNLTGDTTPTLVGTAESGAAVELYEGTTLLGSAIATGGAWTITSSALSEGAHSLTVRATDAAGNPGAASGPLVVTIDTAAPQTTITGQPTDPTNSGSATFTFGGSEGGGTFECRLDGAAFAACGTPAEYSGLADGSHTFQVRAIDVAGNTDATAASYTWTVDTTAPAAPPPPALGPGGASGSPNLTNDNTPALVGAAEPGSTVELFSGSTSLGTTVANTAGEWSITSPVLADGPHVITAVAHDAATNTSVASSPLDLTVDTLAPAASSAPNLVAASDTGSSDADDVTGQASPTFDGTAEANSTVELFDGQTLLAAGTADAVGGWSITIGSLADGTHAITARTKDPAGNVGPASTALSVTVDTAAPSSPAAPDLDTASDSGASSADNLTNDSTPTFNGAAEPNSTVTLFRGGASLATTTAGSDGAWTLTTSAIADGVHAITVAATDAAGNVGGASAALSLTVDTAAPTAPAAPDLDSASDTGSSSSDNVTSDSTATFSGTAEPGSVASIYSGATPLGTTTADGAGTWSFTSGVLADGVHSIAVIATDAAGNAGTASTALAVTVDTAAPSALAAPDLDTASDSGASNTDDLTNDGTPSFTGTADPNSTVTLFRGGTSLGTTTADLGGAWSITAASIPDGVHAITAAATDAAGNVGGASAALSVTVDTAAPATPAAPDLDLASDTGISSSDNVTNDGTPSFTGTAEPNSIVTLFRGGDSLGTTTAGSGGAWFLTTAAIPDGVHAITVAATDAAGNVGGASAALSLTVDTAAPTAPAAPDLDSASDTGSSSSDDLTSDSTATFSGTAEPGSVASIYSGATPLGTAAADGAGTWSFTSPVLAEGAHSITVRAIDAAGNAGPASAVLGVTVDATAPPAPPAPDLDAASDTGASATDDITSDTTPTLVGTAQPNSAVQLFQGATPLGDAAADGAGGWSITSAALAGGVHNLTAVATDLAGNVGPASPALVVTVDVVAPVTTITQAPSDPTSVNTANFLFGANEAVSGFQCSLDGAAFATCASPAGYTSLADGSHTFAVRATDLAGSLGAAASHTWRIESDIAAPVFSQIQPIGIGEQSATVTWTTNEAADTQVEYGLSANPNDWSATTLDPSHSLTHSQPLTGLVPGNVYYYRVKSRDQAGNLATSGQFSFTTIDNPPTVTLTTPLSASGAYDLAIDPTTNLTYVTNQTSNRVLVLDAANGNAQVATITVGAGPRGVAVSPSRSRAYVANYTANNVSVINTGTNAVVATITVGNGPNGVAVDPDTGKVWVVSTLARTLSIINPDTNAVSKTISLSGLAPGWIAINPVSDRAYVTNTSSNNVTVFNTTTEVVDGANIAIGAGPRGVAVNTKTNRIYVANFGANSVAVVNGVTRAVTPIALGTGANPSDVAVNENTNRVYVAKFGPNEVATINGATNLIVNTLAVGSDPNGVAAHPTTYRAYTTNLSANSMSQLQD